VTNTTSAPWTRGLAIVAIAAAGVALSGCSLLPTFGGGSATRDDDGQVVEGNDNTDVFTLQVGDCLNDATAAETVVETIPTVPCSEPHDSEIYASYIIAGDTFPGTDAVIEEADAACLEAFPGFVGVDYSESVYYYSYYFPTEGSWANGDREVLCTISELDAEGNGVKVTGSLENIGR